MKRLFDFVAAILLLLPASFVMVFIAAAIKLTTTGPILHWSRRVGRNSSQFLMPKFRTMRVDTPDLATDKLTNATHWITPVGWFLRRSSLDELPQLYCVITGEMSLVGPRPLLHNQYELIEERKKAGIDVLRPGITGLAQINGRDDISDADKIRYDLDYLRNHTLLRDLKILMVTGLRVICSKDIAH